ncbi:MAG: Sua5/YciO/YrdC/YwlC family protein, partial [Clostridia bacterium]|nr:Sua5/YciO/YrdC/YwlC family protein [Clostridia bacterium]
MLHTLPRTPLCSAISATNEAAVARLRELKDRPFKPFAVMMKDIGVVKRECVVLDGQEELLTG